jgi:cytochrome c553
MANSDWYSALTARGESACDVALRPSVHVLAAGAIGLLIAAAPVASAFAQDAAAGRQKALQCQACHGLDGFAKIPGAPHLAGQVREYLVSAMREYKTGARKNEVMAVAMRQLTDEDIEELAAYYAGLDPRPKGAGAGP